VGGAPLVVAGMFQQLDCLKTGARMHVVTGKKRTRLMMRDPLKVTIVGGGSINFTCGVQKKRRVIVTYTPAPDKKLGTAGDVASLEFPE
jgi:hypothetical protein